MTISNRTALLLGKAVGDALGAGVETATPDTATTFVAEVLRPLKIPSKTPANRPFGQYTDDTQMAREMLVHVRDNTTFHPQKLAEHWADFVLSGKLVGGGRTTVAAAQAIADGKTWEDAGSPRPSNGSAMRAAVVALLNPDNLQDLAATQSRITHTAPAAQAASVIMATAAADMLRTPKLDATHFLEKLAAHAAPYDDATPAQLELLHDHLKKPPLAVLDVLHTRLGLGAEWRKYPGVSVHAAEATLWALYAFLTHADDYMAAVGTAISGGGDADTTAAMTGALAGARLGMDALPKVYLDVIHDNGDWRADDLRALVSAL